jgi:hypothetical protein
LLDYFGYITYNVNMATIACNNNSIKLNLSTVLQINYLCRKSRRISSYQNFLFNVGVTWVYEQDVWSHKDDSEEDFSLI